MDATKSNTHHPTHESKQDFLMIFLISYLAGTFGIDRFILGYKVLGVLKLITFGGLGLWWLIDVVSICFGRMTDKQGLYLKNYQDNVGWAKIVGWFILITNILTIVIVYAWFVFSIFASV